MAARSRTTQYNICAVDVQYYYSSLNQSINLIQLSASLCQDKNLIDLKNTEEFHEHIKPNDCEEILRNYTLNGDMMKVLNMTQEEDGTYLYRNRLDVTDKGLICKDEESALKSFVHFILNCKKPVVLLGIDEESLAILVMKVRSLLKKLGKESLFDGVKSFTDWKKLSSFTGNSKSLWDFYKTEVKAIKTKKTSSILLKCYQVLLSGRTVNVNRYSISLSMLKKPCTHSLNPDSEIDITFRSPFHMRQHRFRGKRFETIVIKDEMDEDIKTENETLINSIVEEDQIQNLHVKQLKIEKNVDNIQHSGEYMEEEETAVKIEDTELEDQKPIPSQIKIDNKGEHEEVYMEEDEFTVKIDDSDDEEMTENQQVHVEHSEVQNLHMEQTREQTKHRQVCEENSEVENPQIDEDNNLGGNITIERDEGGFNFDASPLPSQRMTLENYRNMEDSLYSFSQPDNCYTEVASKARPSASCDLCGQRYEESNLETHYSEHHRAKVWREEGYCYIMYFILKKYHFFYCLICLLENIAYEFKHQNELVIKEHLKSYHKISKDIIENNCHPDESSRTERLQCVFCLHFMGGRRKKKKILGHLKRVHKTSFMDDRRKIQVVSLKDQMIFCHLCHPPISYSKNNISNHLQEQHSIHPSRVLELMKRRLVYINDFPILPEIGRKPTVVLKRTVETQWNAIREKIDRTLIYLEGLNMESPHSQYTDPSSLERHVLIIQNFLYKRCVDMYNRY